MRDVEHMGSEGDDALLARLLEQFDGLRRSDPAAGIGALHEEAGRLFDRLADLAGCERLLRSVVLPDDEGKENLTEFGGYRDLVEIGRGAASVVYRATAPDGRPVALKVMNPTLAASAEAMQRFAQEARAAASLDHKHVVKVFDSGNVQGRVYIAMELLEGSLKDLLQRIRETCGPVPDARWLRVLDDARVAKVGAGGGRKGAEYARRLAAALSPVARALAALAEKGIVHRDIKPGNLVFDAEGNLKVTDFGLAKVFGATITSTAAVLGTPAYMSPEQARGDSKRVDRRTDIYALGATLYEALTLAHPVKGETFGEALAAIQTEPPEPVASFCADYAGPLSWLVHRCLEKEPRDRYQTPERLAEDLSSFAGSGTVSIRPVSRARRLVRQATRHRAAAALVGGTVSVAILAGIFFGTRPAEVRIDSIPAGLLAIDAKPRGPTPWEGTVGPGRHELVVSLDGFRPHREAVHLKARQDFGRDVVLIPLDEAARVRLESDLRARGGDDMPEDFKLWLPVEEPVTLRAPVSALWSEEASLVSPNGRVTRSGLVVALRVHDPPQELEATVTDARGTVLFERSLRGEEALPLPAALAPGGPYKITVAAKGGAEAVSAEFTIVEEPDLGARLKAFPRQVRDQPEARVLAIGQLLAAGLSSEAFLASEDLPQGLGPIAQRLALEALWQMGLGNRGVYSRLSSQYQDSLKGASR